MEPYVKVSAGFYFKNAPEGYLGLRSENWNFGNEPTTLDRLIVAIVYRVCQFYVATMRDSSLEEVNAMIKKAGEAIVGLRVEEVQGAEGR